MEPKKVWEVSGYEGVQGMSLRTVMVRAETIELAIQYAREEHPALQVDMVIIKKNMTII